MGSVGARRRAEGRPRASRCSHVPHGEELAVPAVVLPPQLAPERRREDAPGALGELVPLALDISEPVDGLRARYNFGRRRRDRRARSYPALEATRAARRAGGRRARGRRVHAPPQADGSQGRRRAHVPQCGSACRRSRPRSFVPPHEAGLFEGQLRHVVRHYEVVPADRLLEAVVARRRGQRFPVAITFDDDLASATRRSRRRSCAASVREGHLLPRWRVARPAVLVPLRAASAGVGRAGARPHGVGHRDGHRLDVAAANSAWPWRTCLPRSETAAERLLAQAGPDPEDGGHPARGGARAWSDAGMTVGFHTFATRRPHGAVRTRSSPTRWRRGRASSPRLPGAPVDVIGYPHGRGDERVAAPRVPPDSASATRPAASPSRLHRTRCSLGGSGRRCAPSARSRSSWRSRSSSAEAGDPVRLRTRSFLRAERRSTAPSQRETSTIRSGANERSARGIAPRVAVAPGSAQVRAGRLRPRPCAPVAARDPAGEERLVEWTPCCPRRAAVLRDEVVHLREHLASVGEQHALVVHDVADEDLRRRRRAPASVRRIQRSQSASWTSRSSKPPSSATTSDRAITFEQPHQMTFQRSSSVSRRRGRVGGRRTGTSARRPARRRRVREHRPRRVGAVDLRAELPRRPEVVVVEEADPAPARGAMPAFRATATPRERRGGRPRSRGSSSSRRAGRRLVLRAVVDDDHLEVDVLLLERGWQRRAREQVPAAPRRDDDRDLGCVRQRRACVRSA